MFHNHFGSQFSAHKQSEAREVHFAPYSLTYVGETSKDWTSQSTNSITSSESEGQSDRSDAKLLALPSTLTNSLKKKKQTTKIKSLSFHSSLPRTFKTNNSLDINQSYQHGKPNLTIHCSYSQDHQVSQFLTPVTLSTSQNFATYNTFTAKTSPLASLTSANNIYQFHHNSKMSYNKTNNKLSSSAIELTSSNEHGYMDPLLHNNNQLEVESSLYSNTKQISKDLHSRNRSKRKQFFSTMSSKVTDGGKSDDGVASETLPGLGHPQRQSRGSFHSLSNTNNNNNNNLMVPHTNDSGENSTCNETITDSVIEQELRREKYRSADGLAGGHHPHGHSHNNANRMHGNNASPLSLTWPKLNFVKVTILASLILYTLASFILIQEKEEKWTSIVAQKDKPAFVDLSKSLDLIYPVWKLRAKGTFLPNEYRNLTNSSVVFTIVQLLDDTIGADQNGTYRVVKTPWASPVAPQGLSTSVSQIEVEHTFKLTRDDAYDHIHRYQLRVDTNSLETVPITLNMAGFSELSVNGIYLAGGVLIFLYTLIIVEIVNRTLAAMLGATAAIMCLTLIRDVSGFK